MGQFTHVGTAPIDLTGQLTLDEWPEAHITVTQQPEICAHQIRIAYKGQVRFIHVTDELYMSMDRYSIEHITGAIRAVLRNWDNTVFSTGMTVPSDIAQATARWEQFFGL